MPVYVFNSTDAGAPSITGVAGDVIGVLDACLVNGYNTKTVTITRSGNTATANCTSHGFVTGQRLLISGANEADYNGQFYITVTDANNFTYTVANTPATPATGTISAKVAPVGWTKAYSGTNLASYQQPAGTNQRYLGVDDTSTTNVRVRGFDTMTAAGVAVASGTIPFPSDSSLNGGMYLYKSSSAGTRAWKLFSNGKAFHFVTNPSALGWWGRLTFGDYDSEIASDVYNTALCAATATNDSSVPTAYTIGAGSVYSVKNYNGTVNGQQQLQYLESSWGTQGRMGGSGGATYPSPVYGGLLLCRLRIVESGLAEPRGHWSGIWNPLHMRPLTDLDTFSGVAGTVLEGKKFIYLEVQTSNQLSIVYETSNTW